MKYYEDHTITCSPFNPFEDRHIMGQHPALNKELKGMLKEVKSDDSDLM